MKIVDKRDGTARFLRIDSKGERPPKELTKTSWEFQNRKFKSFEYGNVVIATFRVSENGRRYLLNVRPFDADEVPAEVVMETPRSLVAKGYYYPLDVRRVFTVANDVAKAEGMVTVLMVGPSGYGKTLFGNKFAEMTGRHHVRINCAAIRDPEEWMGFREAVDGSTVFEPTEFSRAIQQGNTVIVLDEINRLEPWLHNTLFPLLDDDRCTVVHNKKFIVAPNTVFVLTLNQGMEFTGTFELDQAFVNRVWATVVVGPPPEDEEVQIIHDRIGTPKKQAREIVKIAGRLREIVERREAAVDCSTRAALRIANLMKYGMEMRAAFYDVVETSAMDADIRKKLADVINSSIGTMDEKEVSNDVFETPED